MITPKNLIRHEIIGLEIRIIKSSDPTLIDVNGTILDESKNTITIETNGRKKRIPKGICRFLITLDNVFIEVSGKVLIGRPHERIKK